MTSGAYLPPVVLQVTGLTLFVALIVFWAFTGRESVLLVGSAGSLVLLGGYERVRHALLTEGEFPSPPPVAPAHGGPPGG